MRAARPRAVSAASIESFADYLHERHPEGADAETAALRAVLYERKRRRTLGLPLSPALYTDAASLADAWLRDA